MSSCGNMDEGNWVLSGNENEMEEEKFSHQLSPLRGVHIRSGIVAAYGGVHEIPKWTVAERHKCQRKQVLLRLSTLNYWLFPPFAAVTAAEHFRRASMFSQICPLSFQISSVGWRPAHWRGGGGRVSLSFPGFQQIPSAQVVPAIE